MKLLVIVGYQNDLVSGSLGFKKAELLEDKIIDKISEFEDYIFVNEIHDSKYLESFEGKMVPVKHCILNTNGSKVYGKVDEYLINAKEIFMSNTHGSIEFGEYLKNHPEYTEIYLCGVVSHMNVLANAIIAKEALPNSLITVLKDLSTSFDLSLEAKAYNVLNGLQIEVK